MDLCTEYPHQPRNRVKAAGAKRERTVKEQKGKRVKELKEKTVKVQKEEMVKEEGKESVILIVDHFCIVPSANPIFHVLLLILPIPSSLDFHCYHFSHMSMASLKSRVEDVRRSETARNTLLDDLLNNVESLRAELEKSQATARHYFESMNTAKAETREIQTAIDCDKFVLVIIDGDSMPFLDDFVSKGTDGGVVAGRRLRNAIEDYHRTTAFYHPNDRILVQVFANLRGLAKACSQANITRQESTVVDFAAGFGSSHPLTNFVDGGSHKEAADSKMRCIHC